MKLSRELWLRVDPLLTTALKMDPAARRSWLDALQTGDPDIDPVLRRMLEAHDRAERAHDMETIPKLAPAPASAFAQGMRVGPFRLLRLLGRGGMGEVWLAEQADGRLTREIALKLPAAYEHGDTWRERFRRERDILAKLAHPNIAHLLDAGVTDAGQPWLAMEFVQGQSLLEGAGSRALPMASRLALFRQVLAAVAHAHRHLVVHRDLKPANILIDTSGQVKLLDFGIAKLIDEGLEGADARDLTRMGGRVMTLRYAAPEQASGGTITTATDIYSLGVILHELVTGASPYRAVREGKAFSETALTSEDPAIPSSLAAAPLARQVAGDVDAILLKAMRRDPAARYASVEQFDDDIARHLERRPVAARAGTWRYLAGRFATRHKLPLAAAAAVLLTLAAGVVMVDRQRRIAVAERERAERHFASVRTLANSFMFDVHGAIENLAGSLKARQLLVSTSLEYLDKLAKEGGSDPDVAVEVAIAYRKLADLKGDVYGANLGDPDAALNNLRKARAMLDALDARRPDDLKLQRERRELALAHARLLRMKSNQESVEENVAAAQIAERVVALPGADRDDRRRLAASYADLAYARGVVQADIPAGLAHMRKVLDILEPMVREDPSDAPARELLASAYERASVITEGTSTREDRERGAELQARANTIFEGLARDFPENTTYRRNLVRGYANLASTERHIDRKLDARTHVARSAEVARALAAGAPEDSGLQILLLRTLGVWCAVESDLENYEKAIALARQALAVGDALPPAVRQTLTVRANVAAVQANLGLSQAQQGLEEKSRRPVDRRLALIREGRVNMLRARAFRQELVDNNIDAKTAALIVRQIDESVAELDLAIARLSRP